jgi:hypothetical protein
MIRILSFALSAALLVGCSGNPSDAASNGGYFYPNSAQFVALDDGAYHWTVIDPPRFGGSLAAVAARATNDVWFFGRDVRHWDGVEMTSMPLDAVGTPGAPDQAHHADSFVIRSATDIWAAGSALWHYDGSTWAEMTSAVPGVIALPTPTYYNHFEIAGDDTHLAVHYRSLGASYYPNGTPMSELFGEYALDASGAFAPAPGIAAAMANPLAAGVPPIEGYSPSRFFEGGALGNVGAGLLDATSVMVPCLRNAGLLWAREGSHFYSFTPGAIGQGGSGDGMVLTDATPPGDFEQAGKIALADLPGVGKSTAAFILPPQKTAAYGVDIHVDGVAVVDGVASYAVRARGEKGEATFLFRLQAGAVTILPDRLYGWETHAIGAIDQTIFLAANGGAVLMGSAN